MKIGMFDSGIGGLTLLRCALKTMPAAEYHYYADTDHVPYGNKSVDEIRQYSDEALSFLAAKGCEAVVIACNTATSAAAAYLREKYEIPVIGIEPAVKPALSIREDKRILVVATAVTVREKKLHELVERVDVRHRVDLMALPGLVGYAEAGEFTEPKIREYLEKEFSKIDVHAYSVIVLGCTHFNHFSRLIGSFFDSDICITDGSEGTIRQLKKIAEERGFEPSEKVNIAYYESGRSVADAEKIAFYERIMKHLDRDK